MYIDIYDKKGGKHTNKNTTTFKINPPAAFNTKTPTPVRSTTSHENASHSENQTTTALIAAHMGA